MKYSLRNLMFVLLAVLAVPSVLVAAYFLRKYALAHPAQVLLTLGGFVLLGRLALLYSERLRLASMKFTVRDLFLVTLCVALALGWWLDRSNLARRINLDAREINYLEHENEYQDTANTELAEKVRALKKLSPNSQEPAPHPTKIQSGPDLEP